MSTIILLSGGLDSAVCLAHAANPVTLTVDYGQRNRVEEAWAAAQLAEHYRADHRLVRATLPFSSPLTGHGRVPKDRDPRTPGIAPTYVPGRNAILLALACSLAESKGIKTVTIGANADDREGYPDCRPEFFRAFERVTPGIAILTPLIDATKVDIARMAGEAKVPVDMTWSCYDPHAGAPCGGCDACQLRAEAFAA